MEDGGEIKVAVGEVLNAIVYIEDTLAASESANGSLTSYQTGLRQALMVEQNIWTTSATRVSWLADSRYEVSDTTRWLQATRCSSV